MVQVEFDFKQALTVIQADSEDIFNNVLDKYMVYTKNYDGQKFSLFYC